MNRTRYFWAGFLVSVALIFFIQGCTRKEDAPPQAGDITTNSFGMKLAFIPAGEFKMGSPEDEDGRNDDELEHAVIITRPFYIGVTEVTQTQWTKVMKTNRSNFKGDDLPVEQISWTHARKFCEKLSQTEGNNYRLPTEAEWEYACRAGATGAFAGTGNIGDMAWYKANSDKTTHPCGTKTPNTWGLYDMHGNVAEWCQDGYLAEYPDGTVSDPVSQGDGPYRVVRGGSWDFRSFGCRCAARMSRPLSYQLVNTGLRVVMEVSK